MAPRVTVEALAKEADLDLDEALVALWDAGIDVDDARSVISATSTLAARNALGLDDPSAQKKVIYWLDRLGTDRQGLTEILAELGIELRPGVRVLPKGAQRRLRRRFEFAPTVTQKQQAQPASTEVAEPFEFATIGPERQIEYLDADDVLATHWTLVEDFALAQDPIAPPGLRSDNLLDSAVSRPLTSLGGVLKYRSVEMAGAALLHSLVLNHPFHNGNKRTGLVALLVFLDRNNYWMTCDDSELFRFVLKVAAHGLVPLGSSDYADREIVEIAMWVRKNTRPMSKGERPLPWLRLKRILKGFGCSFDTSSGVGNRLNITRTVSGPKRLLGKPKPRKLRTQVHYGDDGREVDKNTVHKIRTELELDEVHGVDSAVFYESASEPGDFIQQYRTLLKRLGRL